MKIIWKQNKSVFLAFFVPLTIMLFIMWVMQMTPFGSFSLLISDASAQYIDRITGFRNICLQGKSFFYTWSQLQGSTPYGFIDLSPFLLLYLLVDDTHVLDMLTCVTCLKIACAGLTCAIYLKKVFKRQDFSISLFSWCYALMAYGIAYHFLLSWEEEVILLPLILYGVERLLEDQKKYIFLTICLTASFIMNYYLAYMSGIFTFLYFIYRYTYQTKPKDFKDLGAKLGGFFVATLLAIGCSAFLLVPIFSMMQGRDGLFEGNNFSVYLRYNFSDLLAKLFIGSFDTILPGGMPYIYCGIITLIFIGIYFCSYAVTYKQKIISFSFLAFMILSLTLNPLYVIWHGFKPPAYFEGRFSYVVSLLMIIIAYQGYNVIKTVSHQQIHVIFSLLTAFFLIFNTRAYDFFKDESVLYTLLFIGCYYALIMVARKTSYDKRKLMFFLALCVGAELWTNAFQTIQGLDNQGKYPQVIDYTTPYQKMKRITSKLQQEDQDFYRIEFVNKRELNDGFGVGFPSISHFDSVYNYEVKEAVGSLGLATGHNWVQYEGSTPIVDTLFNVKYVIADQADYFGYKLKEKQEEDYILENPYQMGLGFMICDPLNALEATKPLQRQEEILNKMLGEKDKTYFINLPIKNQTSKNVGIYQGEKQDETRSYSMTRYYTQDLYHKGEVSYSLKASVDGPCYMCLESDNYQPFTLIVNEQGIEKQYDESQQSVYLGNFKKDEKIQVKLRLDAELLDIEKASFYQLDLALLERSMQKLKEEALNLTSYTDTKLSGTITVSGERTWLYLGIPYDLGWQILVDDLPVATTQMMQGFIGVPLTRGIHQIRMIYKPLGLERGLVVSGFTWLVVIAVGISHCMPKKIKQIKQKKSKKVNKSDDEI